MTDVTWSPGELERIEAAAELHIAVRRADGTLRRAVPIWAVCVEDRVYVRTWHRRETGWFGGVIDSGRARISVPGVDADVTVADVGATESRAEVDAAYRRKYGHYGAATVGRMISDDAAAATLRLDPEG